jgi:hypothetical protein
MGGVGGYLLFKAIKEIFGWAGVGWALIILSGVALCVLLMKRPSHTRTSAKPRPREVPRGIKIAGHSLILAIGIAILVWPMPLRFGKDKRFQNDLPAYIALMPVSPPEGAVEQPLPLQPRGISGKVKGKMVVVNLKERKLDDLHFALPADQSASRPEEVGTVVLLTWEKRKSSFLDTNFDPGRYLIVGEVRIFDWKSKSEIASYPFFGDPPGRVSGSGTGPKPDAQVLKFLTGLPRE